MLMHLAMKQADEKSRKQGETQAVDDRLGERGAGIVEWLGISALSIGLLVAVFAGLEQLGLDLIASIRTSLGL